MSLNAYILIKRQILNINLCNDKSAKYVFFPCMFSPVFFVSSLPSSLFLSCDCPDSLLPFKIFSTSIYSPLPPFLYYFHSCCILIFFILFSPFLLIFTCILVQFFHPHTIFEIIFEENNHINITGLPLFL